jgi:DNA-binding MarR family transcriptional regulator
MNAVSTDRCRAECACDSQARSVFLNSHGRHMRGILLEIEADEGVSQRHLSQRLGMALGLTNLLVRRIVAKGWIKVVQTRPNRVRYLLTRAGIAAKARLTREYLQNSLTFYADARERIRERFAELSTELGEHGAPKRIVFLGAGEIAEIGYVSLQETDLQLIGVIDSARTRPFFGLPIRSPEQLTGSSLRGQRFDRLVVMSFDRKKTRELLDKLELKPERVFWI